MFITRQALSKAVHNLEQELGETLIAQRDGTLEPTETGRTLMADAQPVVDVYRALERTIIDRFADEHPNLLLSVESSPTDMALAMVKTGESDIGIVGSAPQYLTDFDALQLVATGTYVHVPVANPLSRRERLGAHDLDGQPFVTFGKRGHLR